MASRVNVRFVVILSAVMVLLGGGVVYSGVVLMIKSAADHYEAGKAAVAASDWKLAETHFSKAVSKEKNNVLYLEGWRDALEHIVPETPTAFDDRLQRWMGAQRQLAVIQADNLEAQRAYLELRRRMWLQGPFNRQACEAMVQEAEAILANHSGNEPGPWEALRRYRGLARLRLLAETPDARDDAWNDARADLEAALRADPGDADAAVGLSGLMLGLAGRAEKQGQAERADELERQAKAILPAFLAANPGNPRAVAAELRRGLLEAVIKFQEANKALVDAGKPPLDASEAGRVFAESNKAAYESAFEALAREDAANLDLELLQSMRALEGTMEPATAPARTQEVIRRALEARPNGADLLALKADLLAQEERFSDAVAQMKAVTDLPNLPVGLEGQRLFFQRSQAKFLQVMWSLRACLPITDAEQRAAAIKTARGYYDAYMGSETADSPQARLASAWMAYVTDDIEKCDQIFENLSKIGSLDVDSVLLWSNVALRRQQPGAARDRLAAALAAQPQNVNAAKALGELHFQLREYEQAAKVFEQLLKVYPDRPEIKERLDQVRAALDPAAAGVLKDPVDRVLYEVNGMARKGRTDPETDARIVEVLTASLEANNHDPRLVMALAMTYRRLGEPEKALAAVTTGSEKHPENERLKAFKAALGAKDEYEMRRVLIDLSGAGEIERELEYYRLAGEFGKADDVKASSQRLAEKWPDDVRVIEVQFIEAMGARDFARAEAMAEAAGRVNADKYGGRTFRARLLGAKGEAKAAADVMQEVVNEGGAQPEVFRLLGRFQQSVGRLDDAIANFRIALGRRPNDPDSIKDLVRALIAARRDTEALNVARNGVEFASGDRDFDDLWLRLEQQVGDATLARERRVRLSQSRPTDRENLLALGDIYLRLNDPGNAAKIADRVRALGPGLDVVALDAAVKWATNDPAQARKVFADFVATAPDNKAKLRALAAQAGFLFARGDGAGAAAALEAAREFQDPKALEADKGLSDLYLQGQQFEAQLAPLQRIIAAGSDTPENTYRKRLVEAMMAIGRFEDARRELEPLLRGGTGDYVAMLLEASVLGGLKDTAGQRRTLDEAVVKFPKEPVVFIKRGQFLSQSDDTLRDAIADFSQAIQLAPNIWQTYRLRAAAYARVRDASGKPREIDRVIDDLKQAVALNPFDNDLLVGLVADLLRLNRDAEAQKVVEGAVKSRPRESIVFVQMANLFRGAGRVAIAQEFMEKAWQLDKGDGVAQRMLDILLDKSARNIKRTEEVLIEMGDARVSQNPGFLMALAKVRIAQNQQQNANRAVLDALRLLAPADARLMLIWHTDMRELQPDRRQHARFLEVAINQGAVAGAADWLGYFRAGLLVEEDATFQQAIEAFQLLARGAQPEIIRLLSWRTLGGKFYGKSDFVQAEAMWREGLSAYPDDPELNNNLAYLLAVHLNRPAEAIALAERATKAAPENPDIADTLAFALRKSGKVSEAIGVFEGALGKITTANTGVTMLSHYAEALLELSAQAPTPEERQRLRQRAVDQLDAASNILAQPGVEVTTEARQEYERVRALVGN